MRSGKDITIMATGIMVSAALEAADKLKKEGFECFIVEVYPTADALEVERIPL